MSDDDKVIRFPGADAEEQDTAANDETEALDPMFAALASRLSEDQQKALQVVLSGMSFVCIGIKPTGSGADFFTALHGETRDLTDAQPHLDGVITRAYGRKGLL